jgi:hypothetical protein
MAKTAVNTRNANATATRVQEVETTSNTDAMSTATTAPAVAQKTAIIQLTGLSDKKLKRRPNHVRIATILSASFDEAKMMVTVTVSHSKGTKKNYEQFLFVPHSQQCRSNLVRIASLVNAPEVDLAVNHDKPALVEYLKQVTEHINTPISMGGVQDEAVRQMLFAQKMDDQSYHKTLRTEVVYHSLFLREVDYVVSDQEMARIAAFRLKRIGKRKLSPSMEIVTGKGTTRTIYRDPVTNKRILNEHGFVCNFHVKK